MKNKKTVVPFGTAARGRPSSTRTSLAAALLGITLLSAASVHAQQSHSAFALVPEGQAPQGITAVARSARPATLATHPTGEAALKKLTAFARQHWQSIGALDVAGLSRYHVEATRGWQAPDAPTFNGAELLAADDESLYLMLRGPRLPASFEIVHRHLVLFARYDIASGELANVSVSIFGEVHE